MSLPLDRRAREVLPDEALVRAHDRSVYSLRERRDRAVARTPDWEALCRQAEAIKAHTLDHLGEYLEAFEANARAAGAVVHWAEDADAHNETVHALLRERGVSRVVKSKSMLTEDCGLNPWLEARGIEVTDTDLGERIVQLAGERPSHIIVPAVHKSRHEISELAEGYQILTRPEYAPYLERFDNVPRPSRLSGPAVETLAIIAYRQPIGRLEIEYIRGVGASGVVRTLQDRRLIDVVGRAEGLGRPLLYGTTQHFLEHFGFRSLEGLPRPEELPVILRERVSLEPESEPDPQLELESEVAADQSSAAAGETAPETETEAEDRTSVDDPTAEPEGDMPDGDPDSDSVDVEDDAEAEPEPDLERSDSV